jgi:acylphosphatase
MAAKRAVVSGRVQGVFFRAYLADVARARGVAGWAANRPDGTVEVHVEGPEEGVAAVIDAARSGPPHAAVDEIEVREAQPEGCAHFATR